MAIPGLNFGEMADYYTLMASRGTGYRDIERLKLLGLGSDFHSLFLSIISHISSYRIYSDVVYCSIVSLRRSRDQRCRGFISVTAIKTLELYDATAELRKDYDTRIQSGPWLKL